MDEGLKHSPLPWRSVYPLGSKQNCAAVDAGDHYVYLTTFREDDRAAGTVAMHQANADLIVAAVNAYASTEAMRKALEQHQALMELACADMIFFHSQDDGPFVGPETPELPRKVAFSVMVNDLFVPAADAEGFDISEAVPLRDVFRRDGYEGVVRWVQQRRDGMPLRPQVEKRVSDAEQARATVQGTEGKDAK